MIQIATRRTLLEVTIYAPARPSPQELLALGVTGACEIRDEDAGVDGQRRWIITEPPPTRWQSAVWERVRLTQTITDATTEMLVQLHPSVSEADHRELAITLAEVIANKLAGGS